MSEQTSKKQHVIAKRALQLVLPLICGILLGTLLLLLAYALPTDGIQKNVMKSIPTFQKEGEYPVLFNQVYPGRFHLNQYTLDNYTDAIMLNSAAYSGQESAVDKAMTVTRYAFSGYSPVNSLIIWGYTTQGGSVKDGDKQITSADMTTISYARYWHGYLAVLKPLLLVFDYSGIRILNTVVQVALILLSIVLMIRRKMVKYILPFCFTLAFLMPPAITQSLQYSTVFYVMILAAVIMLLRHEKIMGKDRYPLIFVCIGIATGYFDLLTYPLASLGIPLTLYFVLTEPEDWRKILKDTVVLALFWGIGYGGMWAGKWLAATLLTGENVFKEALTEATHWTSAATQYDGGSLTYGKVLGGVSNAFSNTLFGVLCAAAILERLLCAFITAIREHAPTLKKADIRLSLRHSLAYVLPFLMPFVWYFVIKNHSYEHQWFTYRDLSVAVFSGLCMLTLFKKKEQPVKRAPMPKNKGKAHG